MSDAEDQLISFPFGLAGFEDAHQYAIIYLGRGNVACLQSIDRPEASLLITTWDDELAGSKPRLSADQRHALGSTEGELLWLLVLNPYADVEWITANLKAPIVINMGTRRGVQIFRSEDQIPIRTPWIKQYSHTPD
ncbi:MAG: flagellar assembly protein FliW [Zetaproteobacteria bacterium]|nr:flagellar assembly protein FliW [Zetaproteobacteria bacterium]